MKDPQERVLEFALREVLGESRDALDLSDTIGEAWRRGERGSGLQGLSAPELSSSRHDRSWARVAAVAGVLVIASSAAAVWVARTIDDERAEAVVDAPAVEPAERPGAEPGGRLIVHGADEFDVDLAGGGRVEGRAAVLGIEAGRVQLEHGAVSLIASPSEPLMLDSLAATVMLAPGARAQVRVDLDVPQPAARWLDELPSDARAHALIDGGASYPRWMTLELVDGEAWIVRPDSSEGSTAVHAGERFLLAEGGALCGTLDDAARTRGRELIAWNLGAGGFPWNSRPYGVDEGVEELARAAALSAFLEEHPHYWPALRTSLRQAFEARGENPTGCYRTVRFLVAQPSEPAFALARELWMRAPEWFAPEHVVALAERGAFEFEREMRAIVDMEPYGEPIAHVLPAAYLALRGDPKGRALLERCLQPALIGQADIVTRLLAARCLAAGGGRDAWNPQREQTLAGVEEAMAAGLRTRAALEAAAIEFFDRRRLALDDVRFSSTLRELHEHCRLRAKRLAPAGALEALVDELRASR